MDAAVLALALHPFTELPPAPGIEKVELDGAICFFHPYPNLREEAFAELPKRWEEYREPTNPSRQYVARIGDEIVGTATASFGAAGINLFGGAVLPHVRGRGVYRALTVARWEAAIERGTPALTVQAGRMSMPILLKLGFTKVGEARIYVDAFDQRAGSVTVVE